jgi:hypothetical protein
VAKANKPPPFIKKKIERKRAIKKAQRAKKAGK